MHFQKKEEDKIEVKYYAKVKEVIEILLQEIGTINEFHIWTTEHENIIWIRQMHIFGYLKFMS